MQNVTLAVAALSLLTVAPLVAQAQTNQPAQTTPAYEPWDWTKYKDKFNGPSSESLTPEQDDWTISAGGAFVSDTVELPAFSAKSTGTAFGGFVATDYFATKALSLEGELLIFSKNDTADGFSVTRTQFALDIGGKFYPVQLTKATECRFQPFVKAALGGVFYDVTATGASVSADPTMFVTAGGGLDIVLNQSWSITGEANYYTTLIDSTLTVDGASTTFREHGFLATVGFRFSWAEPLPYNSHAIH